MFSIADCPVRLVCCDIGQTEEGMLSNTPQAQMYIYSEHIVNIFFFFCKATYFVMYPCITIAYMYVLK